MTSRQVHAEPLDFAADCAPVPESTGLPAWLEAALGVLVSDSAPAAFSVRPEPEAVTAARRFTAATLGDWRLSAMADDVGLVVSELVTNALRHSIPAAPVATTHAAADPIRLRLVQQWPWLLCGILDTADTAPRRKEPDYIAESGRGLHIVDCFTNRWGWRGLDEGGKVVWALFRRP